MVAVTLGLAAGSFISLLSLRMPTGEAIGVSRSRCGGCGRTLAPIDLIPILSFLLLRGRCRTCGSPIPRRYLGLELACVAIALWSAVSFSGALVFWSALLGWQLLLLAILDYEHLWLPRVVTVPLILSGLAVAGASGADRLMHHLIGAAAGFAALALIGLIYRRLRGREGLGGGDAYLLAGAGAWVGWVALPSVLFVAALTGLAAVGLAALLRRPIRADQPLPFGVFLALATWIVWLYGPLGVGAPPS